MYIANCTIKITRTASVQNLSDQQIWLSLNGLLQCAINQLLIYLMGKPNIAKMYIFPPYLLNKISDWRQEWEKGGRIKKHPRMRTVHEREKFCETAQQYTWQIRKRALTIYYVISLSTALGHKRNLHITVFLARFIENITFLTNLFVKFETIFGDQKPRPCYM